MILTDLGPVTAYRMHTPRWATAPPSGAERRHTEVVQPTRQAALYLALEPETAIREYQQLSLLMPPGMLVSVLHKYVTGRLAEAGAGVVSKPRRMPATKRRSSTST